MWYNVTEVSVWVSYLNVHYKLIITISSCRQQWKVTKYTYIRDFRKLDLKVDWSWTSSRFWKRVSSRQTVSSLSGWETFQLQDEATSELVNVSRLKVRDRNVSQQFAVVSPWTLMIDRVFFCWISKLCGFTFKQIQIYLWICLAQFSVHWSEAELLTVKLYLVVG